MRDNCWEQLSTVQSGWNSWSQTSHWVAPGRLGEVEETSSALYQRQVDTAIEKSHIMCMWSGPASGTIQMQWLRGPGELSRRGAAPAEWVGHRSRKLGGAWQRKPQEQTQKTECRVLGIMSCLRPLYLECQGKAKKSGRWHRVQMRRHSECWLRILSFVLGSHWRVLDRTVTWSAWLRRGR